MLADTFAWQSDRFTEPLIIDLPEYFRRVVGQST
jgi:hypothetical protein